MKTHVWVAAAAGIATATWAQQHAAPSPAFAASNLSPKGVAAMAANCAICHGDGGRPAPGSSIARLAGRPAAETRDALKAFRDGTRAATVMDQIARGFSDAEIAALADYFARQPAEES